jgi:hypothetical protein
MISRFTMLVAWTAIARSDTEILHVCEMMIIRSTGCLDNLKSGAANDRAFDYRPTSRPEQEALLRALSMEK